ncbi:MAG: hypothetical protein JOZ77_11925 [Candidatus Eremiobacteraeota bacterium]|nr:hypothetical protein [Candidatus Eremiobacteraeota bacterium]
MERSSSRIWAAAALVLACSIARPAAAVETIPFTDVNGGLIEVQGSVDGAAPVPMLVNLGAGVDVLSTALGRRFVAVDGKYVSLRLTGTRVDLPIGKVLTLALGGVRVDAPRIGIWDGLDGSGVDGLISATAFRNVTTTFDFRNHQMIIEDAQTFPERVRPAIKVPLMLQDDLGIALALFARFDFGGGKSGLCEIDTGSQGITIDKTFAMSQGLDPGGAAAGRLATVGIAGAPATAIAGAPVRFADLIYDCDVGNSFWTGRTFTLDLPNRFMYVNINPT